MSSIVARLNLMFVHFFLLFNFKKMGYSCSCCDRFQDAAMFSVWLWCLWRYFDSFWVFFLFYRQGMAVIATTFSFKCKSVHGVFLGSLHIQCGIAQSTCDFACCVCVFLRTRIVWCIAYFFFCSRCWQKAHHHCFVFHVKPWHITGGRCMGWGGGVGVCGLCWGQGACGSVPVPLVILPSLRCMSSIFDI